jgi:hypothetical protein
VGSRPEAVYPAQLLQAESRVAWEVEKAGGSPGKIFRESRGDGAREIGRSSGGRRDRGAGVRGRGIGCRDVRGRGERKDLGGESRIDYSVEGFEAAVEVGGLYAKRRAGWLMGRSAALCHLVRVVCLLRCRRMSYRGWGRRSLGSSRRILSGLALARGCDCAAVLDRPCGDGDASDRERRPRRSKYRP